MHVWGSVTNLWTKENTNTSFPLYDTESRPWTISVCSSLYILLLIKVYEPSDLATVELFKVNSFRPEDTTQSTSQQGFLQSIVYTFSVEALAS